MSLEVLVHGYLIGGDVLATIAVGVGILWEGEAITVSHEPAKKLVLWGVVLGVRIAYNPADTAELSPAAEALANALIVQNISAKTEALEVVRQGRLRLLVGVSRKSTEDRGRFARTMAI